MPCVGDLARLTAQAARAPVEQAQAVEDRTADAEPRKRPELRLAVWSKLLYASIRPDHARVDEVFDLHMGGQPLLDAGGDEVDLRKLRKNDLVAAHRLLKERRCGGLVRGMCCCHRGLPSQSSLRSTDYPHGLHQRHGRNLRRRNHNDPGQNGSIRRFR